MGKTTDIVGECRVEATQSGGAVGIPCDELRDHRIVVDRHVVALTHTSVDAHVIRLVGRLQERQSASVRQEAGARVLGIDACLERMAVDAQLHIDNVSAHARGVHTPIHMLTSSCDFGSGAPDATRNCHSTRS